MSGILEDTLNLDPIYFIETHRKIKGEMFKILGTGREYLVDLYRYACIGSRIENKSVVVVKGRQVEMTETALNISLYFLKNYKHFTILHSFPRNEQVSRYSKDRLGPAIKDSQGDKLGELLIDSDSDTISAKTFKNENHYYMYSAWGEGDALRGISADMLSRDEFQDWTDDAISNTSSCLDASKYKINFSFGTPKLAGSKFEQLWHDSDQRFYHVKCINCSHLFVITLDNFKTGRIIECPKCRKLQDKREAIAGGKWIPTKHHNSRAGFHVSQLLAPLITREEIEQRRSDYSEQKFKNEVMGEFYSGAGVPLDEREVIQKCAEPYKNMYLETMVRAPKQTFMGIDWGGRNEQKDKGAYTVCTVLSKENGKYKLEHTERLINPDIDKQLEHIINCIALFNSVSVVCDLGFGNVQTQRLQKYYQNRVKGAMYFDNIKNRMKYDKDTWTLSLDRNAWLEDLIDFIKKGNLVIPYKEPNKVNWFVKQICNTELRYRQHKGNVSRAYEKLDRYAPNDALHSLNYAYIASVLHLGETGLGTSAGNLNFGLGMPTPIVTSFAGRPTRPGGPTMNPLFRGNNR